MTALWLNMNLSLHAGTFERFVKLLPLAYRHHIVSLTMEDDDWRIVGVDIGFSSGCTERFLVNLVLREPQKGFLRT